MNNQPDNNDPYGTIEYRTAFKNYVQRGTPIPAELIQRAGGDPGPTVAADLGMIIPTTIMNEFIKKVSKVYGQLYSKVRKLNIQGGVKFPISDLKLTLSGLQKQPFLLDRRLETLKNTLNFLITSVRFVYHRHCFHRSLHFPSLRKKS